MMRSDIRIVVFTCLALGTQVQVQALQSQIRGAKEVNVTASCAGSGACEKGWQWRGAQWRGNGAEEKNMDPDAIVGTAESGACGMDWQRREAESQITDSKEDIVTECSPGSGACEKDRQWRKSQWPDSGANETSKDPDTISSGAGFGSLNTALGGANSSARVGAVAYYVADACSAPAQYVSDPPECDNAASALGLSSGILPSTAFGGYCAKWSGAGLGAMSPTSSSWYYYYANNRAGAKSICKLPYTTSSRSCPLGYAAISSTTKCDAAASALGYTLGPWASTPYGGSCATWDGGFGSMGSSWYWYYASTQASATFICAAVTAAGSPTPSPTQSPTVLARSS